MLLHTHLQLNTTLIRRASRRSLATFQTKRRSFESQKATARIVISLSTLHAKCIKAPNTVTLPKVHGTQSFQCSRQNSASYNTAQLITLTTLCFFYSLPLKELRAGRSGDRIPVEARYSALVQNGPGAHPASWVPGLFAGGKAAGVWSWPPTSSSSKDKERVELYIYSPSGPSCPFLGRNLPLPLKERRIFGFPVTLSKCLPDTAYVHLPALHFPFVAQWNTIFRQTINIHPLPPRQIKVAPHFRYAHPLLAHKWLLTVYTLSQWWSTCDRTCALWALTCASESSTAWAASWFPGWRCCPASGATSCCTCLLPSCWSPPTTGCSKRARAGSSTKGARARQCAASKG